MSAAQVAPSLELRYQAAGMYKQLEPPMAGRSTTYASTVRQNLQSHQQKPTSEKQHQLIVKSKTNATPAEIKTKLKANINPTEIKVGITGLKAFRDGRVIIECEKKEDLEQMKKSINDKLGQELESSIPS